MKNIQLYTKENIDQFDWPENSEYEKNYILPLIKEGTTKFMANVESKMALLQVGDNLFPLTINNTEYKSSYVCSPYNACISYSKEEIEKLCNKPLEIVLKSIVSLFDVLLKSAKINKVVSINNWLLSTNLYHDWNGDKINKITDFLIKKFPEHTIMSRSLNEQSNHKLLKKYKQNGYDFIPIRQIYLFNYKDNSAFRKIDTKRDFKLLKKTGYYIATHDEITSSDYPRITELYNKLYLEKYSYNNPQFTHDYIALWHRHKLLTMQGLRNKNGVLDGIIGHFCRNKIITTPLFGYDTSLPKSLGLYRVLSALIMQYSYSNNTLQNASAGASEFKRLRGAAPEIEYSVIYIKHLSLYRRLVWKILIWILVNIGVPIMKKYKL